MTNANSPNSLSLAFTGLRQALANYLEEKSPPATATILDHAPVSLSRLGDKLQLSAFERMIVLLCAAIELEPRVRSLCAEALGNPTVTSATLGLALSALPDADWSVLSPQNPLHYWQLIHTEPGRSLTQSPLQLDRRILCYLLGEPALVGTWADWIAPPLPPLMAENLAPSYQFIAQQMVVAWSPAIAQRVLPVLALCGIDPATHQQIALTACDRLGFEVMVLPASVLPINAPDLKLFQRQWEREAILSNIVLLLEGDGVSSPDLAQQTAITLFLETLTTPIILSSGDRLSPLRRQLITLDVPALPHPEQAALWHNYLGATAGELTGEVDRLISQFKLTPTAIRQICHQFSLQDRWQEKNAIAENGEIKDLEPPRASDPLWTLCRLQARPNLDNLAQRIEAAATWEDLVLPDRQLQVLKDIATHLTYRAQVYQDWGFAQKGDRGLGISALFYGDSGTGKTMAAEVLAQACRLDLYRIDLSNVVSKYIGETEKNLRRIFDAAETGGVILLFDEADALFGKRTEVKDSHDRHANIEVSYLLQRMEAYQGLAILTSNLKQNLDQAFLRRLRFMVPFPFPDAAARSEIWRRIFPSQTPRRGLDYARLGQLKVAGGNIRNIAINAAFLAAQAKQSVTMDCIRQAAQRDYLKLEKLLTSEELKGWDSERSPAIPPD